MKDLVELVREFLKEPAIFLIILGHMALAGVIAIGFGLWLHFGEQGISDPRFATLFVGSLAVQLAVHAAYRLRKRRGAQSSSDPARSPGISKARKRRKR